MAYIYKQRYYIKLQNKKRDCCNNDNVQRYNTEFCTEKMTQFDNTRKIEKTRKN